MGHIERRGQRRRRPGCARCRAVDGDMQPSAVPGLTFTVPWATVSSSCARTHMAGRSTVTPRQLRTYAARVSAGSCLSRSRLAGCALHSGATPIADTLCLVSRPSSSKRTAGDDALADAGADQLDGEIAGRVEAPHAPGPDSLDRRRWPECWTGTVDRDPTTRAGSRASSPDYCRAGACHPGNGWLCPQGAPGCCPGCRCRTTASVTCPRAPRPLQVELRWRRQRPPDERLSGCR